MDEDVYFNSIPFEADDRRSLNIFQLEAFVEWVSDNFEKTCDIFGDPVLFHDFLIKIKSGIELMKKRIIKNISFPINSPVFKIIDSDSVIQDAYERGDRSRDRDCEEPLMKEE